MCVFFRESRTPQKIPLYKRANWDSLADELTKDIDTITTNAQFNSIQFSSLFHTIYDIYTSVRR